MYRSQISLETESYDPIQPGGNVVGSTQANNNNNKKQLNVLRPCPDILHGGFYLLACGSIRRLLTLQQMAVGSERRAASVACRCGWS